MYALGALQGDLPPRDGGLVDPDAEFLESLVCSASTGQATSLTSPHPDLTNPMPKALTAAAALYDKAISLNPSLTEAYDGQARRCIALR